MIVATWRQAGVWRWLFVLLGTVLCGACVARGYQLVSQASDEKACPAPGSMYTVGGHHLHMVCQGQGSPTVVLEHTGVGGLIQYDEVRRRLPAHIRVCAYDRAGMGFSGAHVEDLSVRVLSDDLHRLLKTSGESGPYLVVAGSIGGLTALHFVRNHAEQVVGLVMLDAASEDLYAEIPELRDRLVAATPWVSRAAWFGLLRMVDPFNLVDLQPDHARCVARIVYRESHWQALASIVERIEPSQRQLQQSPPLPHDLPLTVITPKKMGQVIGGAASSADYEAVAERWRAGQRALVARSSRGKLLEVENSGHVVASDAPDVVAREIVAMVTEIRARARFESNPQSF